MLDGSRELLGDELQDFAVALAEADVFRIALDDQRADGVGSALQRDAQPVDGCRADQFHFTALHQLFKNSGRGEQWLACPHYKVGEAAAKALGFRSGVLFIDEIWEAQQLGLRIVNRNIKIARIHHLTDDVVDGRVKLLEIFG